MSCALSPCVFSDHTRRNKTQGDLLTAYNGTAITYDEIGNPNGYSDRTFTWEHGRQLASQTKGGVEWEYTYNNAGLRTKHSSDSKTYEYVYSGDKLVQMTITDHTTNPETVQFMEFSYDAAGQPLTMELDGTLYYYVLNIQGDVTGLVDGSGNLMLFLYYEGYGRGFATTNTSDMVTTLSNTNPLGYRGYVMDVGTAMYYLQSRYYDPILGRFLNADGLVSTGQGLTSNNMFAYCGNNPAGRMDSTGQLWLETSISPNVTVTCADILSGCLTEPDRTPLPYKTADEAAMAFANSMYSSSSYIRHEFGTVIYSITINGTTTYNFATPVAGGPHSVGYGNIEIPSGVTKVATAHTHPNSNFFSGLAPGATSGDIPNAIRRGLDSYVIGPNLELQKYSISTGMVSVVGIASPVALTSQQQAALVSQFKISWDDHLGKCAFGCEHMTWPTP